MVLKCGIMQVSVCPNRFLGQPCSHNDEANPRPSPCFNFSDCARWWPARSKGVHRIPDLSQHTARSPWVSAGTPRRWQGIASPTRGWNYAHQKRWHSSRGTPRVQEIARQRCNRQIGSDENWFSCLAEDSVRTSIALANAASAASEGADWAQNAINPNFECDLYFAFYYHHQSIQYRPEHQIGSPFLWGFGLSFL